MFRIVAIISTAIKNSVINFFPGMAASSMSQSMASYYNPSAAYGSLSAASIAAAAAAQQSMSAGLTSPAQVRMIF